MTGRVEQDSNMFTRESFQRVVTLGDLTGGERSPPLPGQSCYIGETLPRSRTVSCYI